MRKMSGSETRKKSRQAHAGTFQTIQNNKRGVSQAQNPVQMMTKGAFQQTAMTQVGNKNVN